MGIGEYNLKEIAQEFKATLSATYIDYILPKMVGGTKVGIKNTWIQPVRLKVLPSGGGMYLSNFKDVWGSWIIFASTSKIFTQANRDQHRGLNHAVYSHNIREDLLKLSDQMEKREIRFDSQCKIKTSFYTSPIEDDILQEMGIESGYDLEKMFEESEFIEKVMIDDSKSHFCSVYKAVTIEQSIKICKDKNIVI